MNRIVLPALLLAACTDAPRDSSTTAAASGSFVRATTDAHGRPRFTVDGRAFRFIGGNLTELPWLDPAAQDHELAWAHDMGFQVIRVWGVDSGEGADQMAGRLRGVLDRAAAHGLHVTIALTHNYHQPNWLKGSQTIHEVPGDDMFYSRDCGGGLWCLDDSWIDWGHGANYKQYANRLVSLLRDHPAVFAWDIANETSGSSRQAWIVGRVTDFYVEMAKELKSSDPNHMVTTGMISSSWAGMQDSQRDAVYGSGNVDFLTVHDYESPLNGEAQNDEIWRANQRYGKPVVVEEFGAHSAATTQSYYAAKLHPADPAFEVTGIMYWGVGSPEHPEVTDNVWSPRALGAYDWFVTFWQGWAATLAQEAGGAECVALAANSGLGVGDSRGSCDGHYTLVMQGDANLVLYRNGSGAVWASCTQDAHPTGAVMQSDGNLVVYAQSGPLWNSHTWNHPGARLLFEGGQLVMRAPSNAVLWTSATWCQ